MTGKKQGKTCFLIKVWTNYFCAFWLFLIVRVHIHDGRCVLEHRGLFYYFSLVGGFEEMDVLDSIFMEVLAKVAILSLSSTVRLPNQAAILYLMGFWSTAVLNNSMLFSLTPVWTSWESEFSKTPHFKRDNFLTVPRWTVVTVQQAQANCVICKFDDTVVWFFVSTFISANRIGKVTQPCGTPEERPVNLDFLWHIYEERIIWGFTCILADFGARRFRWNMLKAKLKSINKTQASSLMSSRCLLTRWVTLITTSSVQQYNNLSFEHGGCEFFQTFHYNWC